ncbi:MAG TPA: ABC transporter substrate-binding protein [Rhizomicrobium sp.]|jgi:phospholipid transport system substrate-binding protein|nr:ABC transporter substrate-binding protein [Rhizomicrobium sp.]
MKTACLFALTLVALAFGPAARAEEQITDPAAKQIQSFYDTLVDSMKHAKELGLKGRYDKLKPAVDQTYNLPMMTSLVVGAGWSKLSPADQQALIQAFERMTIANYAKNFDSYDGEKFVVDATVQTRGVDKVVQTKLVTSSDSIPFNYRMRQSGGAWKIVDVYLNGFVSELATRRSDFSSTLASGGAPALIKKINDLADNLMKG